MKVLCVFLVFALCAYAADVKEKDNDKEVQTNKDKRQTDDVVVPATLIYRSPRKQEPVAPVEEPLEEERPQHQSQGNLNRIGSEEYRPGQVFSLNPRELLDLQPERKAPLSSSQHLQQLYSEQQPEHKQNLQQLYYLEQQSGGQVSLHPSHAVIARPSYTSNGGEASVGVALSVSDTGASNTENFDNDFLTLLGQVHSASIRPETYSPAPQVQSAQTIAPQYQQIDRYITKPSKKPTKLRPKVQIVSPQPPSAPQQYLIETTNIQPQQTVQQQYRPVAQPQRAPQTLRYVPIQQAQTVQQYYEHPEAQGLKIVPAPKLQDFRPQFKFVQQYQQPEATPKQYRLIESPRPQPIRQEQLRTPASSIERPITYLKRFPEPDRMRQVKFYDNSNIDAYAAPQQQAQTVGEQFYLRPFYRPTEQRNKYDYQSLLVSADQSRVSEQPKPPQSSIFVSKNVAPKKVARPQPQPILRYQQLAQRDPIRAEQVHIEQYGQSLEDQRAHLPPPKNSKAYTPEEFAALVAAGYSVTPVPVGSIPAQSRSSPEVAQPQRRPMPSRRQQYLPVRDDAP